MKIWHGILALALGGSALHASPEFRSPLPAGSGGIVITILEGEGALNDIRQRTAREPIVQVQDENHRPIAGAAVVFLLPGSGPGGSFADGAIKFSTVTDSEGKAIAKGLQPNSVAGPYQIQVVVTVAGQTAEVTIHQQNAKSINTADNSHPSSPARPMHTFPVKWILIGGGVVAAGAVAAIFATGGSNSTVITAGSPSVGPPAVVHGGVRVQLHLRGH